MFPPTFVVCVFFHTLVQFMCLCFACQCLCVGGVHVCIEPKAVSLCLHYYLFFHIRIASQLEAKLIERKQGLYLKVFSVP